MAINKNTYTLLAFQGVTCVLFWACTAKAPVISAPEPPHPSRSAVESESDRKHRINAAEQLIEQGKADLKNSRPDSAMRSFERAVQLHPDGCGAYYYMAEAWLQKGDLRRARQFNRLARSYADQDPYWERRIRNQARQLKQTD